jgi:putative tricarboxylic transport membrane protein
MTIIASLSQDSTVKGLIAGAAGLMLSTVGMDPISGSPRVTFGKIDLFSGIPFTVALIGLFSFPLVLRMLERDEEAETRRNQLTHSIMPNWKEFKPLMPTIYRSSFIGIVTGLIPGTGGDTACWFAYNEAKRFAPKEEKARFGTGTPYGIAAPESSNNAVAGGALIPTITLGIPGSSATAVMLGGLMAHGIMPGPTLMSEHSLVAYTLIWGLFFANFVMLGFGIWFTRLCVYVIKVPNKILAVIITIFCIIGSFAINNNFFDVYLMVAFGILGYCMDKLKIPVAPLVVGLILGNMLDASMQQSLLISQGSWLIFLQEPISCVLLIIAGFSLFSGTPVMAYLKKIFYAVRGNARP